MKIRTNGRRWFAVLGAATVVLGLAVPAGAAPRVSAANLWKNVFSSKCLHIFHSHDEGAPAYQGTCNSGYTDQQWILQPTPSGYWQVVSVFSSKCLHVFHSHDEGAQVYQGTCNSDYSDQEWFGNGSGQFVNRFSNMCMHIFHSYDEGAPVFQGTCNVNYTDQLWVTA